MESKKINVRSGVLTLLILLAAFSRIVPHMSNFSPLGAIGLFGAAYFNKKWQAFLIPISARWLSDLLFNNMIYKQYYPTFTWFDEGFYWQYGSYLLIILSALFIFKKVSPQRIFIAAMTSTTIFYLVSNFGCFPGNPIYPRNLMGLVDCYAAGLPFLQGTLLGDLFYSVTLFGSFAL